MATIATARTVTAAATAAAAAQQTKKMVIATQDGGDHLTVPYAPKVITYSNIARAWTEIGRPGRTPILTAGEVPLRKQTYDIIVGSTGVDRSMETNLRTLERLARTGEHIVVRFGPSEAGLWRITALTITSVDRHSVDQSIIQATATLELTKASDYVPRHGPVSGGKKPPVKPRYYGGVHYRVRKGDTLRKISTRFYRTPSKWRLIADANKIRRPKSSTKLKVGRRIKIPKVKV